MRDFDTLKSITKPMALYPGTETGDPLDPTIGTNGNMMQLIKNQNGWNIRFMRVGLPGMPGTWTNAGFVTVAAMNIKQIEWSPFRREQIAVIPISQDIAEGSLPQIFFTRGASGQTYNGGQYPIFAGAHVNRFDAWMTITPSFDNISNLVFSGQLPGTEPGFPQPFPDESRLFRIVSSDRRLFNNDQGAIRMDQIISGRYRQYSSNMATSDDVGSGYQSLIPLVHDIQFGGNAGLAEKIYHVSFISGVASTNQIIDHWLPPIGGTNSANNHLFSGFQIPGSIDTLTIALDKVESDAEFGTLAARSGQRRNSMGF